MTKPKGDPRGGTDRHAPIASLSAVERAAAGRLSYDLDRDLERYPCCVAESGPDGWRHSRSCIFRHRTPLQPGCAMRPGAGGAAATDHLAVRKSRPCARCTAQFVPVAREGGRGHSYCSRRCAEDARNARRRVNRPKGELPRDYAVWEFDPIPREVILGGLCVQPGAPSHLWTSDVPAERAEAARICRSCSVRLVCLHWALANVGTNDSGIYGGTNKSQRTRLRAQLGIARSAAT